MQYTIKWSEKAQSDYFGIIDYLLENWGRKSAKDFKESINHIVELISKIPTLYPQTDYRENLRKCVVVKQVSLYYQVNDNDIEIYVVRLLDNRLNLDKVQVKLNDNDD